MTTVSAILAHLDSALASRSEEQKNLTIARVTDMLATRLEEYSDDQISVFDVVIGRLAAGTSLQSRVALADRLADLARAPHGVVRQLALDEIVVARPVLTRSPILTEHDLVAVASTKGRDHMLAITERPHLTENVTDYLVVKGDRVISHALVNNETARFSGRGMGLLVTRAYSDDALQVALGARYDIPTDLMVNLSNAARESARRKLMNKTAPAALMSRKPPAPETAPGLTHDPAARAAAMETIRALSDSKRLDEAALVAFAGKGQSEEALCAIATLAGISVTAAEQALCGSDRDACLVIGKAMGWSWPTVQALIGLRPASEQMPHLIGRAHSNFENLAISTAQRVLQFLRVKDQNAARIAAQG
ncbi:MAG: DUF2336 domain-containing protein [Bosea sp.]|nr:DUF2336 domain-containing protein [Bosea sp. (in: a-proteobacteria)]